MHPDKAMAVYMAVAIRGGRTLIHNAREMVRFIQSHGIPVLSEHVVADDPIAAFAKRIGKAKEALAAEDIERQDIAWIDEATHVIADISVASTGTGREIEYARRKEPLTPVLCLYHISREHYASPMIRGMTGDRYPNVRVSSYVDMPHACILIREFLNL